MATPTYQYPTPLVGTIVNIDKAHLCDDDVITSIRQKLEERGVLVFPKLNATDAEQLAFTDKMGERVNFTGQVPGADVTTADVYKITLDRELNKEPDYVLGTFFWHVDGATMDQPLPKATTISARQLAASGGATEFANLYAAYERLPEEEKREYENLRVIHSVEAAVRPVHGLPSAERVERYRNMAAVMEHPLVWKHADGRKSLLLGTHADGIVGMPGAHGRALLTRLMQWAAQPDFVYRHQWSVGDMVIWDNEGLMHRVVPYTDEGRVMHRTTIAGHNKPGQRASAEAHAKLFEIA